MGEVGHAYAGVRERMTQLLGEADPATAVPACPQWSVKDLAAHVTGVVDDALAGRLDGVATDPWTMAQVETRRGIPMAEIVAEWGQKAPAFEELLDQIGSPGRQAVFDVTTHEHDLRGAVGQPGAHDSDAVRLAIAWLAPEVLRAMTAPGRRPLRLRTTDGDEWCPGDDAGATLTASSFELLRALSGRRSRAQIRALDWQGNPDDYIESLAVGPFRTPSDDIVD